MTHMNTLPITMDDLLTDCMTIFRNKLVGIVEFKFKDLSLVRRIEVTGDVDLSVETFMIDPSYKGGYKIITYTGELVGTDPILDLNTHSCIGPGGDLYTGALANFIIVRSKNIEEPLKIKNMKVMGLNCFKYQLISSNKELIKSVQLSYERHTHITKENMHLFKFSDFIYIDPECLTESNPMHTIENVLIASALSIISKRNLIVSKSWLNDYFEDITEFTCDDEVLSILDYDVIVEENAELKVTPSHKMRKYTETTYKVLSTEMHAKTLNNVMNRTLKPKPDFMKDMDDYYNTYMKTPFKHIYGVQYAGTDSINMIGNKSIHFPYRLISRFINNISADAYEDQLSRCVYVSTDEQPFLDHMIEVFGKDKVIYNTNIKRYDVNTGGTKMTVDDPERIKIVREKVKQSQTSPTKDILFDIYMLSRCQVPIKTHGLTSLLTQVFSKSLDKKFIDLNQILANEKF
jgi:hypothetical protein